MFNMELLNPLLPCLKKIVHKLRISHLLEVQEIPTNYKDENEYLEELTKGVKAVMAAYRRSGFATIPDDLTGCIYRTVVQNKFDSFFSPADPLIMLLSMRVTAEMFLNVNKDLPAILTSQDIGQAGGRKCCVIRLANSEWYVMDATTPLDYYRKHKAQSDEMPSATLKMSSDPRDDQTTNVSKGLKKITFHQIDNEGFDTEDKEETPSPTDLDTKLRNLKESLSDIEEQVEESKIIDTERKITHNTWGENSWYKDIGDEPKDRIVTEDFHTEQEPQRTPVKLATDKSATSRMEYQLSIPKEASTLHVLNVLKEHDEMMARLNYEFVPLLEFTVELHQKRLLNTVDDTAYIICCGAMHQLNSIGVNYLHAYTTSYALRVNMEIVFEPMMRRVIRVLRSLIG
jgi:hypothetical protein